MPDSKIIGPENRGWYVAMTLLDYERSNISGAIQKRKKIEELIRFTTDKKNSAIVRLNQLRQAITDRYIESEVLFNFSLRV